MTGYKRNIVGVMPYSRMQNDMEIQIHQLEQAAYSSVLRAFKAQSDALTWVIVCMEFILLLHHCFLVFDYYSMIYMNKLDAFGSNVFRRKKV